MATFGRKYFMMFLRDQIAQKHRFPAVAQPASLVRVEGIELRASRDREARLRGFGIAVEQHRGEVP